MSGLQDGSQVSASIASALESYVPASSLNVVKASLLTFFQAMSAGATLTNPDGSAFDFSALLAELAPSV